MNQIKQEQCNVDVLSQARSIRRTLVKEGAILLTGTPVEDENAWLVAMASALGTPSPGVASVNSPTMENRFIHRIEPRSAPLVDKNGYPILSTTDEPFQLHTDEYFLEYPSNVVLTQCIIPAGEGGESLVVPLRVLRKVLRDDDIAALRQPILPTPFGRTAAIWGVSPEYIRYNRVEIDRLLAVEGTMLDPALVPLLERFEAAAEAGACRLLLRSGECLIIDNWRVLHGRTAFKGMRLLKRARLRTNGQAV